MTFTKLPKALTAEELLSTPLPPVKWIIPGLLPAGLALFAGPSKAGKSWLTLWLCLQVAQGKPVWGREIESRTVLYLSLEDTLNRLQDRLFRLVGSEDTPEKLILQTECQSIGQGLEEQITSFLYNHSNTGLVVIDTLQKVRSCDQSGSMYASDYKDVSTLKSLADKYGICILLIHHLRKQAASDPFDQISGSNGLMGAADTTWVMQRKRTSKNADIILTGRDLDRRTLYLHPMQSGNIRYTVFSDKNVQEVLYDQDVVAVMTTQEPDKVCHSHIETLRTQSAEKVCNQVFLECFTFDEVNTQVEWNENTLWIICKGEKYEIRVDENQTEVLIKKYTDAEEKSWIVR